MGIFQTKKHLRRSALNGDSVCVKRNHYHIKTSNFAQCWYDSMTLMVGTDSSTCGYTNSVINDGISIKIILNLFI